MSALVASSSTATVSRDSVTPAPYRQDLRARGFCSESATSRAIKALALVFHSGHQALFRELCCVCFGRMTVRGVCHGRPAVWTAPGFVPLSYWLRLGVEGSLVGLFVFGGRGVAQ